MMTGGQIALLADEEHEQVVNTTTEQSYQPMVMDTSNLILLNPNEEELKAHLAYLELINKKSKGNCLLLKGLTAENATIN